MSKTSDLASGPVQIICTGDIMKVLTVISTIFIPLSFLAGVYRMNMYVENHWKGMYATFLAGALAVAGSMLLWFRHKKWP